MKDRMNPSSSSINKRVVLVGAGNAHLQVLGSLRMAPAAECEYILINPSDTIPYSAMVPGFLGGEYRWGDMSFDLFRLCQQSRVRWIRGAVESIDLARRLVGVQGRPALEFDILSLNLGSRPAAPEGKYDRKLFFGAKPLEGLIERVQSLEKMWEGERGKRFGIIGGGAGGVEIALALKRRWRERGHRIVIFEAADRFLPRQSAVLSRYFEKALSSAGVEYYFNSKITSVVELEGRVDAAVFTTQATPHDLIARLPVAKDESGFLRTNSCLQLVDYPFVFAAGDTIHFPKRLPKAGVYSVRQGPVLAENLRRFAEDKPLTVYQPQPRFLTLFNLSNGDAVLSYSWLSLKGRWIRRWKHRIDKKWMAMHGPRSAMEPMKECGGCGSKVDARSLEGALSEIQPFPNPKVRLGLKEREDAAIIAFGQENIEPTGGKVQGFTLDFFRSFLNDPYLLGRLSALNAINDLWAKNIVPRFALSSLALPFASSEMQRRWTSETLYGANECLVEHEVALVGGHTTQSLDFLLGFTVWGEGERVFTKAGLNEGDQLVLTKPLGSGVLLHELNQGVLPAKAANSLLASLSRSNVLTWRLLRESPVTACTDISGFGLARHLVEMLQFSNKAASIHLPSSLALSGAEAALERGARSQIHDDNRRAVLSFIEGRAPEILFDPQTCGGFLFGISPGEWGKLKRQFEANGEFYLEIGKVEPPREKKLFIE